MGDPPEEVVSNWRRPEPPANGRLAPVDPSTSTLVGMKVGESSLFQEATAEDGL